MKPKKRAFLKVIITLLLLGGLINPLMAAGVVQIRDFDLEKPAEPCSDLNAVDFDGGDHAINVIEINPFFTIAQYTLDDGTSLSAYIINGPPKPPPDYESEREGSIMPLPNRGVITDFPSFNWVFGCSAVSGAMIAAYYDRGAYPNMYSGPTNGGVMPITDTSWSTWSDGYDTYPNNPLIASHNGIDGRTTRGSIDNYWVSYGSTANDPYITNGWPQHAWGSAIGDYMKTSQSAWPYGNPDGATTFWNYGDATRLTCSAMEQFIPLGETYTISESDGTYGRKLFYEARGYTVTDCYNQKTDNQAPSGFSLADFQAEIDAGHPVFLNLEGHSIVGYGYSGSTIYIRDTWDSNPSNTYTMPWGGSYSGMTLYSVSVVGLSSSTTPPSVPTGVAASDGTYTDKVRVTWNTSSSATYYQVFRNTSNSHTGETTLTSSSTGSPYDDTTAVLGQLYYYWVKACNSAGCSDYSASAAGQLGDFSIIEVFLPLVIK